MRLSRSAKNAGPENLKARSELIPANGRGKRSAEK